MAYQDTSSLEEQVKALMQPQASTSYASGLANALRFASAQSLSKRKDAVTKANADNRTQELAAILKGVQTGKVGDTYVNRSFDDYVPTDPSLQSLVAKLKLDQAEQASKPMNLGAGDQVWANGKMVAQNNNVTGAGGEYGVTPMYVKNQDGTYSAYQPSKHGGAKMIELPQGVQAIPDSGRMGYDPNAIGIKMGATTQGNVNNINQTALPEANAAGMKTAAQQAAETAAVAPKIVAKAEGDRAVALPQAQNALTRQNQQSSLVSGMIDQAKGMADGWTTGLLGSATASIPGTKAHNLKATLDTIKANVGFDKLQEMRSQSPTGGALGQVSDFENRMLQSVIGSLEQSQSPDQFVKNLDLVKETINHIVNGRQEVFDKTYNGARAAPPTQGRFQILEVQPGQ